MYNLSANYSHPAARMSNCFDNPEFALETPIVHALPCTVTHPMALQTMQAQAAEAARSGDLLKLSALATSIGMHTQIALESPVIASENLPFTYPNTMGSNTTRDIVPITTEVASARIIKAGLMTTPAVSRQVACSLVSVRQSPMPPYVPMSMTAFIGH